MSRSFRKNPFCGWTTARSEKDDKGNAHGSLRAAERDPKRAALEPTLRDVSNVWCWDKDGRQRFDPIKHPKLMRK